MMSAVDVFSCFGALVLIAVSMLRWRSGKQPKAMLCVAFLAFIGAAGAVVGNAILHTAFSSLSIALTGVMILAERRWADS